MKISDLARSQNISKASVSDSVKMLFERGWIVKKEDPEDKRIVYLAVSEDGKKRMEAMFHKLKQSIKMRLTDISERELLVINDSLKIMSKQLINDKG